MIDAFEKTCMLLQSLLSHLQHKTLFFSASKRENDFIYSANFLFEFCQPVQTLQGAHRISDNGLFPASVERFPERCWRLVCLAFE